MIHVAIPADRNVTQTEAEKKLKYKCLWKEIQVWNMKFVIILVVTGATWIETKGLKKNLKTITGKHSIHSLQKTAVPVTSHNKVVQQLLASSSSSYRHFDSCLRISFSNVIQKAVPMQDATHPVSLPSVFKIQSSSHKHNHVDILASMMTFLIKIRVPFIVLLYACLCVNDNKQRVWMRYRTNLGCPVQLLHRPMRTGTRW